MPKVTLKRVLEALTSNSSALSSGGNSSKKKEPDFCENLTEAQFQACKVSLLSRSYFIHDKFSGILFG